MDNVTHTLFGLTLARTPPGRRPGALAALVLASNAPDIDIVTTARGAANYLHWHRGPTHGPLGVLGLGLASAALVWSGARVLKKPSATFVQLAVVSMVGVLLHILMDLPTSYGTRLLSPIDWHWYAADWMPIVDIYLLIILGACLLFGHGSEAAKRRNVSIAIVLTAANYGVRGVAHHEALARARDAFGTTLTGLPPGLQASCPGATVLGPIDRWPVATCDGQLAALPTFFSPFTWQLVARRFGSYQVQQIDLLARGEQQRGGSARSMFDVIYPNQWTAGTLQAAETPLGRIFLGFSRFPAARSFVDSSGNTLVRWIDIRFVSPPTEGAPSRRVTPFSAAITLDPSGRVIEQKFGP